MQVIWGMSQMSTFIVTVTGRKSDSDGGHCVTGWCRLDAASAADAKRAALAWVPGLCDWETDGDEDAPEKIVGVQDVEEEGAS